MTIFQKIVKASELPPEWAKEFPEGNARVRVDIGEVDPELDKAKTLSELMNLISRRVEVRGLTPELLQEILNERQA